MRSNMKCIQDKTHKILMSNDNWCEFEERLEEVTYAR
jgi:hypothetical protein